MGAVFTDRELDIMTVLWNKGPSTVAEVRELTHVVNGKGLKRADIQRLRRVLDTRLEKASKS